jgi:hypothetical protein
MRQLRGTPGLLGLHERGCQTPRTAPVTGNLSASARRTLLSPQRAVFRLDVKELKHRRRNGIRRLGEYAGFQRGFRKKMLLGFAPEWLVERQCVAARLQWEYILVILVPRQEVMRADEKELEKESIRLH